MYKAILLLTALVLGSFAYGQKEGKGYLIKGKITGKDTGMVYLDDAGERKTLDSAALRGGEFRFSGRVAAPVLCYIRIGGEKGYLYVENAEIGFQANVDSLFQARIAGAATDSVFRVFWGRFDQYGRENVELNKHSNSLYNNSKPNTPERAAAMDSLHLLEYRFYSMVGKFVKDYPSSPVAAFVIYDRLINYGSNEKAQEFYSLLNPAAGRSYYGVKINDALELAARTAIGTKVYFEQPDTSGRMMKLSGLKAKYILVDFWASWCGPCRRENPNLVKAYRQYHDKGFDIIGISLDTDKEAWLKAIRKDSLTWTQLSDLKGFHNDPAQRYGVKIIPTNFLVDASGKIVAKNMRGEMLEDELKKLLAL